MASKAPRSRERVARNFIKTYGRTRFHRLLSALAAGESGQAIADEFNVSRERVRQWKNTFGEVVVGLFKVLCHTVRKEVKITFFERLDNAFANYAW